MIPHAIAHPSRPELLQFVYDFDDSTTRVLRHRLEDGALQLVDEKAFGRLLRYPVARGDHWYVAVMEVREFGEPAYIERFRWDDLERDEQLLVDHPRFGFTAMGINADASLAVVDRFFPTDGEDEESLSARVVSLPDMRERGMAHVNAGMSSPVFDATSAHMAMVLYDQDRCSANVYRLTDDGLVQVADLASRQIVTDFERADVAFLTEGRLAVWSVQNWDFDGTVGVYHIESGEQQFKVGVPAASDLDVEDEEAFSFRLENTEMVMHVASDHLVVGGIGAVAKVSITDGSVDSVAVEGAGAIVRVLPCADELIAQDHDNELFVVG